MKHANAFDRVPPFDASGSSAPRDTATGDKGRRDAAPSSSPDTRGHTIGAHDVAVVWERVRQSLQERIRPEQFHTWFQQAELRSISLGGDASALVGAPTADGREIHNVQLAVQNNFTSFFIKTYYMEQLTDALSEALGGNRSVEIVVDATLARSTPPEREGLGADGYLAGQSANNSASYSAGELRPAASMRRDLFELDTDDVASNEVQRPSVAARQNAPAATDEFDQPGRLDAASNANSYGASVDQNTAAGQRDTRQNEARRYGAPAPLGPPTNGSPRVMPPSQTPGNGNRSTAPARNGDVAPAQEQPRGRLLSASDVGLNSTYRFETFVVGPCNRFAHAAALGVSEAPGQTYNPLFLHGNVGLGKTHLIQSLCHSILARDPSTRILYLSCESFVNHFVDALDKGDLQRFRNKYRNVDVLVVDDIHLLANKERTQEEFFHTFNTLYNAGKQIVLSSDSPPKDIPTLQSRLVSRFKWGLVTEIEPPCYETRRAILKRKSREKGNELPDDVASDLAEAITANIRELEGAVTRLLGYAALSNQPVSVALARECLRDLFEHATTQPNIEDVLRVVTSHFQIRLVDLQSRKRTHAIAYARQVGMYLARKLTRLSLQEIGGHFGGRDHSTVLYAVERIKEGTQKDAETLETVRRLEAALSAR